MQDINSYPDFVQLASRITQKPAYDSFSTYMDNIQTLKHIFLNECVKSNELIFAACEILGKKILKGQILKSAQDMDPVESVNSDNIKQALLLIATKLYEIVNNQTQRNLQPFIVRSILNAITLCMFAVIKSNTSFSPFFISFLTMLAPDFAFNEKFITPTNDNSLYLIQAGKQPLPYHHKFISNILMSLIDYFTNGTYFINYYTFRRSLYSFRNSYLAYLLNYSIFAFKTMYQSVTQFSDFNSTIIEMKPILQIIERVVMFPFSLTMHQYEIQDEMHENISGLQSEIYFPSYFRSVLCDTAFLLDLMNMYSYVNGHITTRASSKQIGACQEQLYIMVRIIGRLLSSSQYIFMGEEEKKGFRAICLGFMTRLLKQTQNPDSYLILCLTKINLKFMSIENQQQLFEGKREYFQNLIQFIRNSMRTCTGKIEDGDKHPYRQLFELLTGYVNISANTNMDAQSKMYAQEVLEILIKQRLCDNVGNAKMMAQFGSSNSQEVDCFQQIFSRVAEIFKIHLEINLTTLNNLNFSALNSSSLTFWLHLTSNLLPEHDTSNQQTQLIIKFLNVAIQARSIASLHYIETLVKQILFQLKEGVSTTYLWQFIEQSKGIKFEQFLTDIIRYAMQILTVPNYILIQNCLQLFKTMFSQLCRFKHKSFTRYFQIIEQVCIDINQTMLVRPQYTRLRIGFFSIISIIWINQGQLNLVYKVFTGVRQSVNNQPDLVGFMRYMTDITGLLQPVETAEVYKILVELVIKDMTTLLPYFFSQQGKLQVAFGDEGFLKIFIRFVMTIVTDNSYRLSEDVHTELPFKIQETFRPYLIETIKYDYPKKTVQTWLKFLKLNPLSPLLPLDPNFKLKNPQYKTLLRQYFQNLHRLTSLQEFYELYKYIGDNIQLMMDWWQQIMARGLKPDVNVGLVASSHIWSNNRQKEMMGRLMYRIGKYEAGYWSIHDPSMSESMYSEWFMVNFE